ncbi:MAG TPA: helix-turn-helix transcriptional regulator [Thermoanaerobaculia bacterium]
MKLAAEIGVRLRAYREEYGLNQKELADSAGISRSQLARYEAGEDLPQAKALINLSIFMERRVDWILFGEDGEGAAPADLVTEEIVVEILRCSKRCRRAWIEMSHALIMTDQTEARLLASGNGQVSADERD